MSKSAPGGPSTIKGILYQFLYSLSTFGELCVVAPLSTKANFEDVTIVLEPSDGGDHQVISGDWRKIEQLKIRTDGIGTWSLKEIIESVLPDLYRAVDFAKIKTEFVLVTEGRRGSWSKVEDFFLSLDQVQDESVLDESIDSLDDASELKFQRQTKMNGNTKQNVDSQEGFWGEGEYTKKRLFDRIVDHLGTVGEIKKSGDNQQTIKRKLFYLLSRIKFEWETSFAAVESTIQAWVSELIDAPEKIANCINAMIADLQNKATSGDEPINANAFLSAHGLNCIALSNFGRIRQKAESLHTQMLNNRIRADEDPRTEFAKGLFAYVQTEKPHLILIGESGQGKSWLGFSVITEALRQQHLAFAVPSRGTAYGNVEAVGEQFWQRIVGHGNSVPYANTVAQLAAKIKGLSSRRVFVFLEGSLNIDELRQTCLEPWENWNTTLVLNCFPKTFAQLDEVIGNRFNGIHVPDFSHEETKIYLAETAVLYNQLDVPVQQTIRRPFFAAIFKELAAKKSWGREIEYQLYDQYWKKLLANVESHDVEDLLNVAFKVFTGECRYPFGFGEMCVTRDPQTPERIIRSRWIRKTLDAKYEFWHRRLLDWAIAIAVIENIKKDNQIEKEIAQRLGKLFYSMGKEFGFVPMDVMWLAIQEGMNVFALKLQLALEGRNEP